MYFFVDHRERVLTATWTPQHGLVVTSSDLPDVWLRALARLAHDVHVRQYGDAIEHIEWVALYDTDGGAVWLASAVTTAGKRNGLSGNGTGAAIDADEETALVSMADLVQTEVAEAHTAWPWGDAGGFLGPHLVDGIAVWKGRNGRTIRIGSLDEKRG